MFQLWNLCYYLLMTECHFMGSDHGDQTRYPDPAINFRMLNLFLSNNTWKLIILIFDIESEVKESHIQKKPTQLFMATMQRNIVSTGLCCSLFSRALSTSLKCWWPSVRLQRVFVLLDINPTLSNEQPMYCSCFLHACIHVCCPIG